MLPSTIHARVAPETISKVVRLFNGSLDDILIAVILLPGGMGIATSHHVTGEEREREVRFQWRRSR